MWARARSLGRPLWISWRDFGRVSSTGRRPSPGKMEVAVAIGTDPALTFSAIVPAPPDVEEYLIAGFLRQKPVELVKCETVDLEVPAAAEIILEGYVHSTNCAPKAPSATTPAFTRSKISILSSTFRASLTARIRSIPPPLWASRRWKMDGWARRSSASFCR